MEVGPLKIRTVQRDSGEPSRLREIRNIVFDLAERYASRDRDGGTVDDALNETERFTKFKLGDILRTSAFATRLLDGPEYLPDLEGTFPSHWQWLAKLLRPSGPVGWISQVTTNLDFYSGLVQRVGISRFWPYLSPRALIFSFGALLMAGGLAIKPFLSTHLDHPLNYWLQVALAPYILSSAYLIWQAEVRRRRSRLHALALQDYLDELLLKVDL